MKKLAFLVLPAFLLLNACTGTTEGAEKYAGTYTTNYVRYCTGSIPACNETGTRSVEVIKGGANDAVKISVVSNDIILDGSGSGVYSVGTDYAASVSFRSDSIFLSIHTHSVNGDSYSNYVGKK